MSSGWDSSWSYLSRMTYDIALCHPDKRNNLIMKSSEWLSLSHPYDLAVGSISSGWLMANVLSHPDDIRSFHKPSGWNDVGWILCHPDEIAPGRISSRRLMTIIRMTFDINLCHPHEIINLIPKSSKWLNYCQYLIRMTYGHCSMSPGWLTILTYLIRRT